MKDDFLNAQIGRTAEVLIESERDGLMAGFTGNYCEVGVRGEFARNETVSVKITGKSGELLIAEPL